MTFCRTVLFDEKKEVPDQVGEDNAIGGVAGRRAPARGGSGPSAGSGTLSLRLTMEARGRLPPLGIIFYLYAHESFFIRHDPPRR